MSHPLGELMDAVMTRNGWSDRKVAEQARAAGYKLGKSRIWELRNQPLNRVEPDTLHALAAALHLPARQVMQAALESAGVTLDRTPVRTPEEAVREDTLLSERDKETILALLRTLRNTPQTSRRAQ